MKILNVSNEATISSILTLCNCPILFILSLLLFATAFYDRRKKKRNLSLVHISHIMLNVYNTLFGCFWLRAIEFWRWKKTATLAFGAASWARNERIDLSQFHGDKTIRIICFNNKWTVYVLSFLIVSGKRGKRFSLIHSFMHSTISHNSNGTATTITAAAAT